VPAADAPLSAELIDYRHSIRNKIEPALTHNLEADDRAEGNSEIIVRARVEVDFVAGFETQADGAEAGFDSGGGVESRRSDWKCERLKSVLTALL